jgi:uncharacterized protein YjbJ (UPF0337 family)
MGLGLSGPGVRNMNWHIIEGKWKELRGAVRETWGELTDDEVQQVEGKRERLEGLLKAKYGMSQEAAAREIDQWAERLKEVVRG